MSPVFLLTLLGLGVSGAFVAGLLGVGGAIVMIPLLLYVPPSLGVGALDVKSVTAVTMVQVFIAACSGMLAHRRHKFVDYELAWVGGLAMAIASFLGATASHFFSNRGLLLVFALMVTAAAPLMLVPTHLVGPLPTPVAPARFNRARIVAVTSAVGLVAGLVGAGGAFLLVPLLLVVVGVPLRVTIGSSLAITALAATAGVTGKLITGQVPFGAALAVSLGAVPGAQLGAAVSRQVPAVHLKRVLLVLILLTAVRVWWDLFSG